MFLSNWFDSSSCKGCEYGECVTAGVFCNITQGLVPVGYKGCKAQNDLYKELRWKEKGITLTELANELRKVFDFKYLTADNLCPRGRDIEIALWEGLPELDEYDHWQDNESNYVLSFCEYNMPFNLDLSEYADAYGYIDYSKLIVEV